MKKFILQLLLFCIPVFLVAIGGDIFLSKELKKSHILSDEFAVWNDLYNGKINANVVVYGSSRAWRHIDPNLISDNFNTKAYNLGINGHNFWLQYLRHSLLLKYNRKPSLIINSLDIYTFSKKPELFNPNQFLPYMLFNKEMKEATIDYKGYTSLDYELPFIRYYGKKDIIPHAFKLVLKADTPVRVNGYQNVAEKWNNDFDIAKKNMDFYEIKFDTSTIHLFEKYIQECKAAGIKLVFVYTPEYIEGQKFVKNREELFTLCSMFSNKYNIPFLDYSADTMSLQKKYFENSEHLTREGAAMFTNKLIDTLKTMEGLKNILGN